MNKPERMWIAAVLCACCLILMPYASADGLPEEGIYNYTTASSAVDADGVLLPDLFVMTGRGHFDAADGEVDGGGEFNHITPGPIPPGPIPFEVLASGIWEATEFISWVPVAGPGPNPYGQTIAGTLTMSIRLFPDGNDDDDDGIPATLTVVCNVPPAGNFTGLVEGIMLDLGGLSFGATGTGVTLHTVGDDGDDDGDDDDDDSDSD